MLWFIFHTNNDSKYCGPSYAYFQEHGLKHEKALTKTPQNGSVARMNITLSERVRHCVVLDTKLPYVG